MKAVIKSVSTEIFENIIYKKCSVLNSKTTPNCETPFKVYVYCSKAKNQWRFSDYEGAYENSKGEIVCAQQRVAAEFVCDSTANGWHISDLKIYDRPKELSEFYKYGAESLEKLFDVDGLCPYCSETGYGEHKYDISSRWGMVSCEGSWCDEAYQQYLDENFALTRAPSNWCYVEEL